MSFDWNHMEITSASRRQILQAEAVQSHLAFIARKRTVRIYGPVMFRVGGWLMTWGRQLQVEYGEISNSIQEMRESDALFAKQAPHDILHDCS
jgi:hypothetical protein